MINEFYLFFWDEIGELFYGTMIEIHRFGELSNSQKKSLIKLTCKKNGRHLLRNYSPISLLNTDIKLIIKILANSLAKVLPNIIHKSQKCIPGRKIKDNIHLAQDLIESIIHKGEGGACIFLD